MCTDHSMLRKKSMWDWYTQILQPMWSTTKESAQMHISNDKWLITSTRIFYKSSSASLDCISELCRAVNCTVATVHEKFSSQHRIERLKFGRMQHMKFITWNKRNIWKPKQYKITGILLPRNILQLHLRS